MSRLFLMLLVIAPLRAQIAIYTLDSVGAQTEVQSLVNVGQAPVGDLVDTKFRLRNLGNMSVMVQVLRISGAGYSLIGYPPLPHLMAAGTNVDFRVRFQPTGSGSFSASLQVNDAAVLILGTSPQSATVLAEIDGQMQVVSNASNVVLGRVERGKTQDYRFLLRNDAIAVVGVNSATLSGTGFSFALPPVLPANLVSGQAVSFTVSFAPDRAATFQANLTIDSRVFKLEAVGFDPPLPLATLSLSGSSQSATQAKLSLQFVTPPPVSSSVGVTMEFRPAVIGVADDPAAFFVVNSSRSLSVPVSAGVAVPVDIVFQTGTTAGSIVFTVLVGTQTLQATTIVAASRPGIDKVNVTRGSNILQVDITGFDNTRSASTLDFTFYDRTGAVIAGTPVRADASNAFKQYFQQSTVGGMFTLRATFPTTGDVSQISGLEVSAANSAGTANSARTSF
jgi:hypothetical protein